MTYDVAIIGGGLAGLSLARQLLLTSDKRIVMLERRAHVPPAKQKVGEATVQISGYYFSKVLDLEEHLLREHFMKYNLRFYWKTPGRGNARFEDYSQTYIRAFSNVASYQLDRNRIEAELLRLNLTSSRFTLIAGASTLDVDIRDAAAHELSFTADGRMQRLRATWVVDASGRGRVLARRQQSRASSPIHHGSTFLWVDGLLNIEKLTDFAPSERLRAGVRRHIGHLPVWLATNHFMGEGYWLWVIPLHGRTSLGLVYDNRAFPVRDVATAPRLVEWICREWPLFARDLPDRRIVDQGAFREFSYDCTRTLSRSRWAMTGESGRFSDPLYSPGGDLIAIHNTLIVDAIGADPADLPRVCARHEQVMRALYEAYVPAYATSYEVLGDQETMTLKYTWELAVYFALYVFPYINGLLTNPEFVARYLPLFARLGRTNRDLQVSLRRYYESKKSDRLIEREPRFVDLMNNAHLRAAESTMYEIGLSADNAIRVLHGQLASLQELAGEIVRHVHDRATPIELPDLDRPTEHARP
jgi:2-polyprenyl-6-methoxyphenol hydroxylase-like FAD-dependent oxidoreductase